MRHNVMFLLRENAQYLLFVSGLIALAAAGR
jgi:hypothetical protein